MMLVNNVDNLQYVDELIYFYVNQPIRIMKIYEQVHMAKVFCLETKKKVIIDIGAITKEPSKESSISIRWLEGMRK